MSNDASVKQHDEKKVNIFKKLFRFLKDSKSELAKVVWPTKKQVTNNTFVVIVCMLVAGGFIWLLDSGLTVIIRYLMGFVK